MDVIISNCVINLSPDKQQVFNEAFRVLHSGGRLAIFDIVLTAELAEDIQKNLRFYSGCISGASYIDHLKDYLEKAGFESVRIESKEFIKDWALGTSVDEYIVSAVIEATKP